MPTILDMIKLGLAQSAQANDQAAFESWFASLVEEIMLDAIAVVVEPCPN